MCAATLQYPYPLTMCKHYSKIRAFPFQSKVGNSTQGTLGKCQSHQVKPYQRTLLQRAKATQCFFGALNAQTLLLSLSIVFKAQNKCYFLQEAFFTTVFNDPSFFRPSFGLIIFITSHFNCLLFLLNYSEMVFYLTKSDWTLKV